MSGGGVVPLWVNRMPRPAVDMPVCDDRPLSGNSWTKNPTETVRFCSVKQGMQQPCRERWKGTIRRKDWPGDGNATVVRLSSAWERLHNWTKISLNYFLIFPWELLSTESICQIYLENVVMAFVYVESNKFDVWVRSIRQRENYEKIIKTFFTKNTESFKATFLLFKF